MALRPFRILSFCSGIGGLDVGVKRAIGAAATTVAYVEGEAFCAAVLQARMGQGLDEAPIWDDVKTFDARAWRGAVDCIIGGYPCQGFSAAGRRKGKDDPRHLWPWIAEHIQAIKPAFVFCENVAGHLTLGFEQVCEDLSAMGYTTQAGIFSAFEAGAPHTRKRLFFLAHANSHAIWQHEHNEQCAIYAANVIGDNGKQGHVADTDNNLRRQQCTCGQSLGWQDNSVHAQWQQSFGGPPIGSENVADADSNGREQGQPKTALQRRRDGIDGGCKRPIKSRLGQPADGSSDMVDLPGWGADWEDCVPRVTDKKEFRIDRLRALGNAVVPATAALAWRTLYAQALNAQMDCEARDAE